MKRLFLAVTLILACQLALPASGAAGGPAHQFDFLIGTWDVEVIPKVSSLAAMIHGQPKLQGTWKAWSAFDGRGVVDELKVIDSSGNPKAYTHSLRLYDADSQRWLISALDVYRARVSQAQGVAVDGELQIDGQGNSHDGSRFLTRTRFTQISQSGFTMQQDRSFDDGVSWEQDALVIIASRS